MRFLVFILALLVALPAGAQIGQPVNSYPLPRVTTNKSGTIAVTDTFQTAIAANTNRSACTIENNGTHTMWVFLGAAASATKGTSVALAAGQSVYCGSNSILYQGELSITGTSADAYYGGEQ